MFDVADCLVDAPPCSTASECDDLALLGALMRWLATGTLRMLIITDEVLGDFFIGNKLIVISCSL